MKKSRSDEWVNEVINEVGAYSSEHRSYMEKFNRLLKELDHGTSSDSKRNYLSFKETIDSFEKYISANNIVLNRNEEERLAVITGSGLNSLAKKRMAEDLIHKIRDRHSRELSSKADEQKKDQEIALLKKSPAGFVNWLRLTGFALEYGSITLLTHRVRASVFNLIKIRLNACFREVEAELLRILDDYYVYLSTLEYNSLIKLCELSAPLDRIAAIPARVSYTAAEIKNSIRDLARVYIYIFNNSHYIEKGLKKIYKDRKAPHGFWGDIGTIIDKPLFNNKPVRYGKVEYMSKSIGGALFSCYSIIYKVRVVTLNQLMYLADEKGILNDQVKHLSLKALEKIEQEEKHSKKEESRSRSRFSELQNLTERFPSMGDEIAERIFQYGARAQLKLWRKEGELRPFYKMMKVLDGYSRFFLDVLTDSKGLILVYDEKPYENYFDRFPVLVKSLEGFNQYIRDLEGGKGKEIYNIKVPDNMERELFIRSLSDPEDKTPLMEGSRSIKETLGEISSGCYNLCLRFNDIINTFNRSGRVEKDDQLAGYDFFRNARVSHPRLAGLEVVLGRKEVSLEDILEGGCAIALYVASFLNHYGIEAIRSEVKNLKEEMIALSGEDELQSAASDEDSHEEFKDDLTKVYTDTLTGFKRPEYFDDFISPEHYDSNLCYRHDKPRSVFCAEPLNLVHINRKYGREEGDRVYREFTAIVSRHLGASGNVHNVAIRHDAGMISGYINDLPYMEAVDLLGSMVYDLKSVYAGDNESGRSEFIVNFGIYPERKGTNAHYNLSVAKKIMMQGVDGRSGHVTFLRNQNRIISENDFDRMGHLDEDYLSTLD